MQLSKNENTKNRVPCMIIPTHLYIRFENCFLPEQYSLAAIEFGIGRVDIAPIPSISLARFPSPSPLFVRANSVRFHLIAISPAEALPIFSPIALEWLLRIVSS